MSERSEVFEAGHRSVLVGNLTDGCGWRQSGKQCEVDRGFGVTRAFEDSTRCGPKREDVTRSA
jgi:hypothetical protein